MNIIMLLVLSYIIPIIVFFILTYCNMEKGESIEDYFDKNYSDMYIFFFIPIFNITLVLLLIMYGFSVCIYNLIKDWRK